jgi:hypothetical protein
MRRTLNKPFLLYDPLIIFAFQENVQPFHLVKIHYIGFNHDGKILAASATDGMIHSLICYPFNYVRAWYLSLH